jgi:hypothetical protein
MALKALEDYDRGEGMKLVKSIGDTYWGHKGIRIKIGHKILHVTDLIKVNITVRLSV